LINLSLVWVCVDRMSEVNNSPVSNKGGWQEAIAPEFQERLMRPLVKPGVIDKAQLAGSILSRSERFANRLPLVSQLESRFSGVKNLPTGQVPIVYAQPLSGESKVANTATPGNSPASGQVSRAIVQAKFAPAPSKNASTSPSAIAPSTQQPSSPLPVVRSQSVEPISAQQNLDSVAPSTGQNAIAPSTQQPSSPLPVVRSQNVEAISASQKQEPAQSKRLPIVYAEPLTNEVSNLDNSLTVANSQPLQTQVNPLPVVQPRSSRSQQTTQSQNPTTASPSPSSIPQTTENYSQPTGETKSSIPIVQITNPVRSWLEPQPHPLLKNQAAANTNPNQTFSRETAVGATNLGTPLVFSTPPSLTGQGQPANNSGFTSPQQNSEVGQANYNPATAITTVSQQITPNYNRSPAVESARSEGNNTPNNNSPTKIDVDALADKVERKLMRRLVIENERRGQTRWR
jgi:hypothetical protein